MLNGFPRYKQLNSAVLFLEGGLEEPNVTGVGAEFRGLLWRQRILFFQG